MREIFKGAVVLQFPFFQTLHLVWDIVIARLKSQVLPSTSVFSQIESDIGVDDIPVPEEEITYFIWVTTPTGQAMPVILSHENWMMALEVAAMTDSSVEEVVIDIAKDRFGQY